MSERTEVVRRERMPESFLFGPQLAYGTLNISAAGVLSLGAIGDRGVLADAYCNAVVISCLSKSNNTSLTTFPSFMIRLGRNINQASPMSSDVVILHSVESRGTVLPVPLFAQIYTIWIYRNAAATYAAETDGIALCATFS